MSDADIAKAVGPFWRNGAPVATLDDVIARQAAELDALRAENARLRAALEAAPSIDGTATALDYITWHNTTRREALDG